MDRKILVNNRDERSILFMRLLSCKSKPNYWG